MDHVVTLRLALLRSTEDEAAFGHGFQAGLGQFYQRVRADNIRISAISSTLESGGCADGAGALTGEFVIPLAQSIGPVVAGAAAAWLQGRAGRRLRLKFGDVDAEPRTFQEIERLVMQAKTLRENPEKAEKSR